MAQFEQAAGSRGRLWAAAPYCPADARDIVDRIVAVLAERGAQGRQPGDEDAGLVVLDDLVR